MNAAMHAYAAIVTGLAPGLPVPPPPPAPHPFDYGADGEHIVEATNPVANPDYGVDVTNRVAAGEADENARNAANNAWIHANTPDAVVVAHSMR